MVEGWKRESVGSLFDVQLGKMLNKTAKEKAPQYPYLTNINVRWGAFDVSQLNTMFFSDAEKRKFELRRGDILVCEGGEIGRCAVWDGSLTPCYYQKALHRLRPKGPILPRYFQAYLGHISGTKILTDLSSRTSIAHLTREKLIELPILLPPLPEQRKIAEILRTWDEAIEKLEALRAAKERQKRALMQIFLTGKRRFSEFEGQPWREVWLGEVAEVDRQSLGSGTEPDFEFEYISLSNVEPGRIVGPLEKLRFADAPSRAQRIVEEGDILVSTVRPNLLGFARVGIDHRQCIASTGFAVVTSKKLVDGSYLFHFLFSNHMKAQFHALVVGSNYPAINSSDVKKLRILAPSLSEQQKLAELFDMADREIALLKAEADDLTYQKRGLTQKLLTGEWRVTP